MSNDTLVKRLANAGLVLMPAQLTDEELTKAQGALLDMNWDAVECFAARLAELYRVTRHRVEEAATLLEQQAAEIERLKEALGALVTHVEHWQRYGIDGTALDAARAALLAHLTGVKTK